jgi:type IV pilus assembly protein PilB
MAKRDDYLLDLLQDLNMVKGDDVALRGSKTTEHEGVVDLLLKDGLIKPMDIAQAKARHFGAEVIDLEGMSIPPEVIALIRPDIARKYGVIPIVSPAKGTITVAISDPSNLDTIDSLHHLLKADIELRVASEQDIAAALEKYYPLDVVHIEENTPAEAT